MTESSCLLSCVLQGLPCPLFSSDHRRRSTENVGDDLLAGVGQSVPIHALDPSLANADKTLLSAARGEDHPQRPEGSGRSSYGVAQLLRQPVGFLGKGQEDLVRQVECPVRLAEPHEQIAAFARIRRVEYILHGEGSLELADCLAVVVDAHRS